MKSISLDDKMIGDSCPSYIVAEIGGAFSNFEEAKRLIDSAIDIGIDAVKFQTLEADTITTKKNYFSLKATGDVSQYEIFKHFELSKELQFKVVEYANSKKIPIFSAPSHLEDLKIMKVFDLQIYKIGSDLACHIPLLKEVAKIGKPIILSTGMCTMKEVRDSVKAIKSEGNDEIILMHCVSNYPSKFDELNLRAINSMKKEFDLPVGFSDHTIGTLSTITSVAMGANIVERHFRDPLNAPGPDDIHSLVKNDFEKMIIDIRNIESSMGTGEKVPAKSELKHMKTNRVSIIAMSNILKGEIITEEEIDIRRPGFGIQPIHINEIIGKTARTNIKEEEPIQWEMLE